jgi:hypothetical protein
LGEALEQLESLRQELARTRKERDAYVRLVEELLPPSRKFTAAKLREQLKFAEPARQAIDEIFGE